MKRIAPMLGLVLAMTGCFGDTTEPMPEPEPQPQPDGVSLDQRFDNNRENSVQTFSIDASTGGTVVGSAGTSVTFGPNALTLDGQPVEGAVDVALVEFYDRAGMLLNNRSTSGVREDGSVEVLKSAGQFFINATQNGSNLDIAGFVLVDSRPLDPADIDPTMALFRAGADLQDEDNWEAVDQTADGQGGVGVREGPDGMTVRYNFAIGEFGWTNLDRWYSFEGELTDLYVQAPDGYDGDNSALFLTYDGEPTALASMDIYDDELGLFTEHYGRIPVGQQVHLILVTDIDGELHYSITAATIEADQVVVMPEPTPGTQTELEAAINALP